MGEVKIISVELMRLVDWTKRWKLTLNQEIYLKYSKTERDYIYVEARDEIEAYKKGMAWLKK